MPSQKRKNYSPGTVMNSVLNITANEGMIKAVHKHTHNASAYVRRLIMADMKINEYGIKI